MIIITALNNREIATAIWFVIISLWAMSISSVRRSFRDLLKAFFNKKILISFIAMLFYIVCMVIVFLKIGLWDASAIKDTLLWIVGSAFAIFFGLNKASQDDDYFKNTILNNLKFVLVLEFVVNLYSFSLIAELIIIPIVSFIVVLNGFVDSNPKYKLVSKFLNSIMVIFGFFIVAFTLWEIILDFENFASLTNLRDFFLPLLFSIALLPFVYTMALFMQYENLFIRIDIANENPDIANYIKRKVLATCNINLSKIKRVSKKAGFPKVNNKKEILEWFKKEG